jgi:hypothetical protein
MKLYDVEQSAQGGIADAGSNPVMKSENKFDRKDFKAFKV